MYFIKDYNPQNGMCVVSDMSYGESDSVLPLKDLTPSVRKQILGLGSAQVPKLGIALLAECLEKDGVARTNINPMRFNGQNIVQVCIEDGNPAYQKYMYYPWSGGEYPSVVICADDVRNMQVVASRLR